MDIDDILSSEKIKKILSYKDVDRIIGNHRAKLSPISWGNYWASRGGVLFFAETKNIADGKLYNQAAATTDYLTVTGAAGSYTFQCPDTAPYIAADIDYLWFWEWDSSQRIVTTESLIGFDFTRTIIKYKDTDPYNIEAIMILSANVDTANMRNDFHLSIWWDDTLSLYGYTKGNRLSEKSVWLPYPAIFNDGNTAAWWDAQDLTNITKDAGTSEVTLWKDKSGNGHDLAGGAATTYPIWSVNGILFDGINDYLKAVAFDWNAHGIYMVINTIAWSSSDHLFDGDTDYKCYIRQQTGTPIISYCNVPDLENSNMALGILHIIRLINRNGNETTLQIDNTVATTTLKNVVASDGFTLGARGSLASRFGNFQVQEIILRTTPDTLENEALIYNYLKDKYGL